MREPWHLWTDTFVVYDLRLQARQQMLQMRRACGV